MNEKYDERKGGSFLRDPETGALRADESCEQTVETGPRRRDRSEAEKQPVKTKQKKGD